MAVSSASLQPAQKDPGADFQVPGAPILSKDCARAHRWAWVRPPVTQHTGLLVYPADERKAHPFHAAEASVRCWFPGEPARLNARQVWEPRSWLWEPRSRFPHLTGVQSCGFPREPAADRSFGCVKRVCLPFVSRVNEETCMLSYRWSYPSPSMSACAIF